MLRVLTGKDQIFADGALRKRGDVWNAKREWKYTEAVEGEVSPVGESQRMTRKELMTALTSAGVPFKPTMKSAELQALLDAATVKAAPASAKAPPKEFEGVGNQDVI